MITFEGNNVPPNGIFWYNNERYYMGLSQPSYAQPVYRIYIGDKCIFPKRDLDSMYRIEITESISEEMYFTEDPYSYSIREYKEKYNNTFVIESLYPCYVKEITDFSKWAPVFYNYDFYLHPTKALAIVFPSALGSSWKILAKAKENQRSDYNVDGSQFDKIILDDETTICPSELDTIFITETIKNSPDSMRRSKKAFQTWDDWTKEPSIVHSAFTYSSPALMTATYDRNLNWGSSTIDATYAWLRTPDTVSTNRFTQHVIEPTINPISHSSYSFTPYQVTENKVRTYTSSNNFTLTFSRPKDSSGNPSNATISGSNIFGKSINYLGKTEGTPIEYNYKQTFIGDPFAYVSINCIIYTYPEEPLLMIANGEVYGPVTPDSRNFSIPFKNDSELLDITFINFVNNSIIDTQVIYGINYNIDIPNKIVSSVAQNCGDDRVISRLTSYIEYMNNLSKSENVSWGYDLIWPSSEILNYYQAAFSISKRSPPTSVGDANILQVWENFNNDVGYIIYNGYRGGLNGSYDLRGYCSYALPIDDGRLVQVLCGLDGPVGPSYNQGNMTAKIPFYRFFNGTHGGVYQSGIAVPSRFDQIRSYSVNMCNTPTFDSYDDWKQALLGG